MTDRGELAESLVARLRTTPAAWPDVAALARDAGIGRRELDALFHDHYHVPAADFLRCVRMEAGLGDDADCLAVRAMPRAAWDRLGRAKPFTLTLPGDFHAAVPLRWLGRDVDGRTEPVGVHSALT